MTKTTLADWEHVGMKEAMSKKVLLEFQHYYSSTSLILSLSISSSSLAITNKIQGSPFKKSVGLHALVLMDINEALMAFLEK